MHEHTVGHSQLDVQQTLADEIEVKAQGGSLWTLAHARSAGAVLPIVFFRRYIVDYRIKLSIALPCIMLLLIACGGEPIFQLNAEVETITQAQADSVLYRADQEWLNQNRFVLFSAQSESLSEYALRCDQATGITVPAFNCDDGVKVPGQGNGTSSCDTPNVLNGECDPGSRFQVLPGGTADAVAVAHCRKVGLPTTNSLYNDIAVIQYNKQSGAVCFYQALTNMPGQSVPAPLVAGESPWQPGSRGWLSPARTEGIGCTGCHDNGGFIRSPYLAQLSTPPHILPNTGSGFNNLTTPLKYVGLDFAANRSWSITAPNAPNDPGPSCTSCHRLATNNHPRQHGGTAGRFATIATAATQRSKNPHSPSSPIWMRPGQVFYDSAAEASAKIIRDCALGFIDSGFVSAPPNCRTAPLGEPWTEGIVVETDLTDDPSFISPPSIAEPLYQCATQVTVRNTIPSAKVRLFIDGSFVDSLIARRPQEEIFNVPGLVKGQIVTAHQELNGVISDDSAPVMVGDYTVDYPNGLPEPEIDPDLIYECGDIMAIKHVPGVLLTVFSNGGDPVTVPTSTDYSAVRPSTRPFNMGDSFTAQASLCGDISPMSAAVSPIAEPSSIAPPTLKPDITYEGQELISLGDIVYGAHVAIEEASIGIVGELSWPVSWYSDFDVARGLGRPLSVSDQMFVSQSLCSEVGGSDLPPVQSCDALPAPKIGQPIAGHDHVVVTESVPGARIHVFDDGDNELGDSSGTVITLNRPVTEIDTLTVVQQIGKCTSRNGYRVGVINH